MYADFVSFKKGGENDMPCQIQVKCKYFVQHAWLVSWSLMASTHSLIGRFTHRYYNNIFIYIAFTLYFQRNCCVHRHDAWVAQYYHISQVKCNKAKTGNRFRDMCGCLEHYT